MGFWPIRALLVHSNLYKAHGKWQWKWVTAWYRFHRFKEICRKKNGKSSIWFDQHLNFLLRNWTVLKHLLWSVSKFEVLVLSHLLTYFSHMRSIQHEYLEFRFLQTVPLWLFPLLISAFFFDKTISIESIYSRS